MQRRDKPLELLNDKSLVEHVLQSLPEGPVLISANRSLERYRALGWPVITDDSNVIADSHGGPLAGIAAAAAHCTSLWLYVVPGDTPRLPKNLAALMLARCQLKRRAVACVHTDRLQPLPLLLRQDVLATLPEYLAAGDYSVKGWLKELEYATLDQSEQPERFININTLEELAALNR